MLTPLRRRVNFSEEKEFVRGTHQNGTCVKINQRSILGISAFMALICVIDEPVICVGIIAKLMAKGATG